MEGAQFRRVDTLSNLPDNVLDNILMRLTIRDAAKTSILSKQWRYKWVKLPQLIFSEELWDGLGCHRKLARMKFLLILYHALLLHQGPITKCSLIIPELDGCSQIDILINFLSKNGIEEFTFEIEEGYKLPCAFFMCSRLKYLNLSSCLINPPPTFRGFNGLTRLELDRVTIDDEVLERLISSCPLLEQLVLNIHRIECLNIDAPKLKIFELTSFARSVCFKKCPLLADVSLRSFYCFMDDYEESWGGYCACVQFCDSVIVLEKLDVEFYYIKNLTPANFVHLKILVVSSVCLDSSDELSSVLCLIRSSPNLEKIAIFGDGNATGDASRVLDFLKVQDFSGVRFDQLQEVELKYIIGRVAEMAIMKLLLEKSPKLKRMVVCACSRKDADNGLGILTELNTFHRASPDAAVYFESQ